METRWKSALFILATVNTIKELWELFSSDPLLKSVFKILNVNSNSTFTNFLFAHWLLLISIVIMLVVITPVIHKKIKGLEHIVGREFMNATIVLDRKHYIDCTFKNCTLQWNGEPYKIDNFRITGTRRFETKNYTIQNTVSLLKTIGFLEEQFSTNWKRLPKDYFD